MCRLHPTHWKEWINQNDQPPQARGSSLADCLRTSPAPAHSWVCRLLVHSADFELASLHNHMSPFLIINSFIYMTYIHKINKFCSIHTHPLLVPLLWRTLIYSLAIVLLDLNLRFRRKTCVISLHICSMKDSPGGDPDAESEPYHVEFQCSASRKASDKTLLIWLHCLVISI